MPSENAIDAMIDVMIDAMIDAIITMQHAIWHAMGGTMPGAGPAALCAVALAGCGHPFEPGADLPAEAPPAVLSEPAPAPPDPELQVQPGAEIGDAIEGLYVIEARLQSPLGDAIDVRFDGHFAQVGVWASGSATLMFELRDPAEPDVPGPGLPAPVPLAVDGAFVGAVPGMTVSPRFSDLLRAPAAAEITLDGRPVAAECLAGRIDLILIDAEVTLVEGPISLSMQGTFTAARSPGACPDGGA